MKRRASSNRVQQGSFTKFLAKKFRQLRLHKMGKKITDFPYYKEWVKNENES